MEDFDSLAAFARNMVMDFMDRLGWGDPPGDVTATMTALVVAGFASGIRFNNRKEQPDGD